MENLITWSLSCPKKPALWSCSVSSPIRRLCTNTPGSLSWSSLTTRPMDSGLQQSSPMPCHNTTESKLWVSTLQWAYTLFFTWSVICSLATKETFLQSVTSRYCYRSFAYQRKCQRQIRLELVAAIVLVSCLPWLFFSAWCNARRRTRRSKIL